MLSLRLLVCGFAVTAACVASAQLALDWQQVQNSAYNKDDNVTAIVADAAGNTYVTGSVQYTLNGGTRTAIGTAKFDNSGNLLWATTGRSGLNGENDFARGIALDSMGNVYVTAECNKTTSASLMGLFKYNGANGAVMWGHFYNPGPGHHNVPVGVGVDSSNRICIAGTSGDGSNTDFASAQYSTGGVLNWQNAFNPGIWGVCNAMKVTSNGDLYMGGLANNGTSVTGWVVKYNASSVKQYDVGIPYVVNTAYEPHAIDVGSDGSVCLAGASFDSTTAYLMAARFSSAGAFQWVTMSPSTNNSDNIGYGVAMGPDGSVYATGGLDIGGTPWHRPRRAPKGERSGRCLVRKAVREPER